MTGAAGFVGSHLVKALALKGFQIRGIDCFLKESYSVKTKKNNWKQLQKLKEVQLFEFDLRDPIPKKLLRDVEYVINLAAMPGLVKSWQNFPVYESCNVHALFNLLNAIDIENIKNFIHISTSSVYGKSAVGNENDSTSPISPYGLTKLAAEELIQMWHRNENLQFTILRYFSVYGPNQRPDMAYSKFISAILHGSPIDIFGDGTQSRTNTYVKDCVEGTILALEKEPTNEIINISGEDSVTILGAILQIEEILGKKGKINWNQAHPGDQFVTRGDIAKAKKLLNYNPQVSFSYGITEQINWHKSQF